MKTNDLIKTLSRELKPVRRLPPPGQRALTALASGLLCVGVGVGLVGLRVDLPRRVADGVFLAETLLILAAALSAGAAAFLLSVPGANKTRASRWLPFAPLAAWGLLLCVRIAQDPAPFRLFEVGGLPCAKTMLILAFIPSAIVFIMVRRAAPLELGVSAALAALSGLGLAAAGMQLVCPGGDAAHLLVWHFSPLVALIFAAAALSRRLLGGS